MFRPCRTALMLSGIALLALLLAVFLMPGATRDHFLSEEGPLELASALAWLAAGGMALWRARGTLIGWAHGLVFAALAVRETGLPKDLIPSGKRLVRWSYYQDPATPLMQRVLIGTVLLLLVLALLYTGARGLRYLLARAGWRKGDGQFALAAFIVLVLSQAFEMLPERLGIHINWVLTVAGTLEESMECISPLLLMGAIAYSAPRGSLFGRT